MGPGLPLVDYQMKVKELIRTMDKTNHAFITKDLSGRHHILSQYDLLRSV
jgi:hypothetical protein